MSIFMPNTLFVEWDHKYRAVLSKIALDHLRSTAKALAYLIMQTKMISHNKAI